MVESVLSMFHLRRVQFQAYVKEPKSRSVSEPINDAIEPSGVPAVRDRSTMILLDKQTKIGRNPELVDVVLHSVVHSNMISRDHSEIIGETDSKGNFVRYFISDRSLNGTYVNDTRVKENVLLKEGDLIKFGHVNGAAIKPGEHAPQDTAEFIFRFERALPKFAYFGYSKKGLRVQLHHQNENTHNQQQHRRAYMQINSDRILPTEVYASLAPSVSASAVGGVNGPTVPRPIAPGGSFSAAVTSSASSATTAACSSSTFGAPPACSAPSFPFPLPSSSSSTSSTTTSTAALIIPSCLATTSVNNNNNNQIAQLNAVAAATTLANTAAASNSAPQQQQQRSHNQCNGGTSEGATNSAGAAGAASTLNALNQLGLTSATEEQVAAVNAHLRQLMASHDAMSAMERLAAQQQWNNSLLKLSSLQQQNPLVYGHAFPAAAAAAAALFTGCIDLNSGSQSAAAAQYAASLWPNIRALQPSVSQSADWTQQQKAAALAQQLQLRLPGLYQQQQQQAVAAACLVQPRGSSVSLPSVAPSLFGTPSAFSLPGAQLHNTNSSTALPSTSSAGLLIAAQQQCVSSSAAYASCTSSASSAVSIPPVRPLGESPISSLSRGTSSVSLPLHQSQGTSVVDQQQQQNSAAVALAARLAAAQQLAKELEADQQAKTSNNTLSGWTMGIPCSSAPGTSVPVTKMSPVTGPSNGSVDGCGGATTPLQRIPGIASALAAAVVAAQQQHQHNNVPPWPSGTPPNNSSHPSLDTPPIRQPLAQRIFSPAISNSSSLSMTSGSSKSSSGVSSAPSSGLLQSPGSSGTTTLSGLNHSDAGKEFRDSFSSLLTTNSLTTSAFSSPQVNNNTNLITLSTEMFATEREKAENVTERQRAKSMSANASVEIGVKVIEVKQPTDEEGRLDERKKSLNQTSVDPLNIISLGDSSLTSDQEKQQIKVENAPKATNLHGESFENPRKIDGMAHTTPCEEKREQMECDSSVPSPPPLKEQSERFENVTEKEKQVEDFSKRQREKVFLTTEGSPQHKKRSFTDSPISPSESIVDGRRDTKAEKGNDGNQKPKPIKQARKSNEVARLLNDLTAGNCSWQYMAERSQKLAAQGCKSAVRADGTDSAATTKGGRAGVEKAQKLFQSQLAKTERKRPLRLEERKKAEMERKRAHKMMRQISDESSDEEHNGGEANERREGMGNSTNSDRSEGQRQQRHSDTSRKEVSSPQLSSSDEREDDDCHQKSDLEDSDSSNHQHQRHRRHTNSRRNDGDNDAKMEGNSQTEELTNGTGTVVKRKLLSSAPGTKKGMMNNVTTSGKLENGGQRDGEGQQKRGPKGGRTENRGKAVRSPKKVAENILSADVNYTALKKKTLGKKNGNGRGRPVGNAQKAVVGSSNSGDSSDDDSSIDQQVRLTSQSRVAKTNGGESTIIKGTGRRGRHKGRRRDESSPDLATTTVAEDWTGGNGDPELCAHRKCQRPLHMSINWVQCDDCDQWFHSTCVFGANTTPDDDADFHCGCKTDAKKTEMSNRKSLSLSHTS